VAQGVGQGAGDEIARPGAGAGGGIEVAALDGGKDLRDDARLAVKPVADDEQEALEDNGEGGEGGEEEGPHHRAALEEGLEHRVRD
jgi:hypothetical protein